MKNIVKIFKSKVDQYIKFGKDISDKQRENWISEEFNEA